VGRVAGPLDDPIQTSGTPSLSPAFGDRVGTYCWGNSYSIDAWGNLLLKTVTAGSAETWSQPADGKNHISAWGYDPVGNQNSVSGHVYNLYNAENQWTSQSLYHVNYMYDGDGKKVKDWGGASGQRIYVQDPAGHAIMEVDQNGTTLNEYLYLGDSRIARVSTEGGPVYYYYGDHLGTARVITDGVGNKCYDADYFPWGLEQHVYANSCPQNYKFTGKERDPDTGSDYFGARWYRYDMSRFFSPDWSATVEPVPYAKLDNPQSLNLYSYVLNNPLSSIDNDGHDIIPAPGLKNAQVVMDSVQAILADPNTSANLAGYVGAGNPDLTIQSGDLSNQDEKSPNGATTAIVQGQTLPDIQTNTISSTDINGVTTTSAPETTLTGATITIDNRTSKGDTPGVMVHESVHAGEAKADPAKFSKDAAAEKSMPHDRRPQEKRAIAARKAYTGEIKKRMKQIENDRKKKAESCPQCV